MSILIKRPGSTGPVTKTDWVEAKSLSNALFVHYVDVGIHGIGIMTTLQLKHLSAGALDIP
jgi:hypothetical protein